MCFPQHTGAYKTWSREGTYGAQDGKEKPKLNDSGVWLNSQSLEGLQFLSVKDKRLLY